jgi:hypothetical protein
MFQVEIKKESENKFPRLQYLIVNNEEVLFLMKSEKSGTVIYSNANGFPMGLYSNNWGGAATLPFCNFKGQCIIKYS